MRFLFTFIFISAPLFLLGQDYDAIVSIYGESRQTENGITKTVISVGTGVVVGIKEDRGDSGKIGYIATAYHVVSDATSIRVGYFNGRTSVGCSVVASNESADIAIVYAWIPPQIDPVELYLEPRINDIILCVGKTSSGFRKHEGPILLFHDNRIIVNTVLSPGDSGGPMFYGDRLAAINSGGWFWLDNSAVLDSGATGPRMGPLPKETWPATGGRASKISELLESLK